MFSIQYPIILSQLGQLAYGFQPVRILSEGRYCLLMKITKEAILTARINQQIKIYLIPNEEGAGGFHGIITAFFDDLDEPIVLFTPLYVDDALLEDLRTVLTQASFDFYFFDELDREIMGVRAHVEGVDRLKVSMDGAFFQKFNSIESNNNHKKMGDWFARRTADEDTQAFTIQLDEQLFPNDLMIIDARPEAYDFNGADISLAVTSLQRDEPGSFQERDIVLMLSRAFFGESIFLNPERTDTGRELADILCLTDDVVLLVQAKDSPNNEAALRRTIDRKRAVIRAHIKKATAQLRGTISYIKALNEVPLRTTSGEHILSIEGRPIFGMVVVREMFDDDYRPCSAPVLSVVRDCETPCVLLDYAGLHVMTLHLGSSTRLMNGFYQLFEKALELGEYPKPRFNGEPSNIDECK